MAENENDWLWFDEEETTDGPLRLEQEPAKPDNTAVSSREVVSAVPLYLAGKVDEAITELKAGAQKGLFLSEIYSTLGQIYFERQKYQEAAEAYGSLSVYEAKHKTAFYNRGVCLERL